MKGEKRSDQTGDQTGETPDAEYTINTAIPVGGSVLIRNTNNEIPIFVTRRVDALFCTLCSNLCSRKF